MFPVNWTAVLVSALIPLVVGFAWYNPKTLGTAWMKAAGLTEEKLAGANMPLLFGLSLVMSLLIAFSLPPAVIHQTHVFSMVVGQPGFGEESSALTTWLQEVMSQHGDSFRTFGHGALHGALVGVFLIFPTFATNALFERKGWAYIAINSGYWILSLALMGAVICGWR